MCASPKSKQSESTSVTERPKDIGYGQKGSAKQTPTAFLYEIAVRDRDFPNWEEREFSYLVAISAFSCSFVLCEFSGGSSGGDSSERSSGDGVRGRMSGGRSGGAGSGDAETGSGSGGSASVRKGTASEAATSSAVETTEASSESPDVGLNERCRVMDVVKEKGMYFM